MIVITASITYHWVMIKSCKLELSVTGLKVHMLQLTTYHGHYVIHVTEREKENVKQNYNY